jgi:uncharacterized protein YcbX
VLHVHSLFVHPIKSARAVRTEAIDVTATGPRYDRAFMVVDDRGEFITAREQPALARLEATIADEALRMVADGGHEVRVPLHGDGEPRRVRVFDDEVDAIDCGAEAAGLLTTQVGIVCRLVRMAEGARRSVDPRYAREGDIVSFADGYPLLVTTTASLDAVFGALGAPTEPRRFRPNIIVACDEPFAEDGWSSLRIGAVSIDLVKPCARCVMVDVDPAEGKRSPGVLAELGKIRKVGNNVLFGQNGIPRALGTVRVGDVVTAFSRVVS